MEYSQDDYLMISGIQHFKFCRRQWALIHVEQQWAEREKIFWLSEIFLYPQEAWV